MAVNLMLGLIREGKGTAVKILQSLDVDLTRLRSSIENSIPSGDSKQRSQNNIPMVKQAERVLELNQ